MSALKRAFLHAIVLLVSVAVVYHLVDNVRDRSPAHLQKMQGRD